MKDAKKQAIPFQYRAVPGLGLISIGKRGTGLFFLLASCSFLTLFILRFDLIRISLRTLTSGIALLAVSRESFLQVFTAELLDFWAASLYLLITTTLLFILSIRAYRNARNGKESPDSGEPSLRQLGMRSFMRNPIAMSASVVIFILYSVAFLAPYLAPYSPYDQQDFLVTAYQPPMTRLQALVMKEPRTLAIPFRKGSGSDVTLTNGMISDTQTLKSRNTPYSLKFVNSYRIENGTVFYTQGSREKSLPVTALGKRSGTFRPEPPGDQKITVSRIFPLGTDQYGRDIFSRVIYGSRISLSIGFLVVLISVTLGTVIGVSSGYFGGWADSILMRVVDVLIAFPALFLILIIIATFGNSIYLIVITLSFTGWMGVARIVRSQVLSLKEQEFILAAKSLGLSHLRIIFRHLVPNTLTPVIVAATLRIGSIILTEAGLSFLGLGVQPPTPSWGNIINEGRDSLLNHWWISTFPGIAILTTVVCFNLVGDGVRDALDPRMRG